MNSNFDKTALDLDELERGARRQAVPDALWMNATNVLGLVQRLREAEHAQQDADRQTTEILDLLARIAQLERVREAAQAFLRDHERWMGDRNEEALVAALEAAK
jgi:hypothetical protein